MTAASDEAYRKVQEKIEQALHDGMTILDLRTADTSQLTVLPESLGKLTQLRELSVVGSELTTLPESVNQLTKLQKLDIYYNELEMLPESLGQLTELQELDVDGNQLTALPEIIRPAHRVADTRDRW